MEWPEDARIIMREGLGYGFGNIDTLNCYSHSQVRGLGIPDMCENACNHRSTSQFERKLSQLAQLNHNTALVRVTIQWIWSGADEFERFEVGAVGQRG